MEWLFSTAFLPWLFTGGLLLDDGGTLRLQTEPAGAGTSEDMGEHAFIRRGAYSFFFAQDISPRYDRCFPEDTCTDNLLREREGISFLDEEASHLLVACRDFSLCRDVDKLRREDVLQRELVALYQCFTPVVFNCLHLLLFGILG